MQDQARTSQHASSPNIQLAHTLHGAPAMHGKAIIQSVGPNVGQATQFSTAPYIPPDKVRKDGNRPRPMCEVDKCAAYAMKGKPYCSAHGRQFGLLPTCTECKRVPMGDTGLCFFHQPKEQTDEPG